MGLIVDTCLHPEYEHRSASGIPIRAFKSPIGQSQAKEVNGPVPKETRPSRALLIGINYEGTSAQLKGCQNDALDMKNLLMRQYGFRESNIRILLDRSGYEYPSRDNILSAARWLVDGATPGDCLFFHFSGHGAQQEDPNCMEEDCMDETICPADFMRAGQIVDDELFDVMIRPLPSGVKMTAVMDCCHSGTGLDLPFTYSGGTGYWGSTGSSGWTCDDNPCHSEGHVVLLSGCADDQTSADVQSVYQRPRGAMTEAFVETLTANPCPTYPEFLRGIRDRLSAHGHSQRPQLTSSQAFDLSQTFEVSGGICPNLNPVVGRQQNKVKYPKRDWLAGTGDPLGDILMGAVLLDLATDPGFGMGMGGLFGDGYGDGGYGGDGGMVPADGGYGGGFDDGGGGGFLDMGGGDDFDW